MTNNHFLNIGVLLYGCGHHQAAWRMKDSNIEDIGNISYYQHLAQIAEKGLLDIVFFADNQAFNASDNTTMPAFGFDPIINLSAIAQVTSHIGLVPTISSTFSNPFTASRQLLSLDYLSHGRVGWNLVTSMTDIEAQNHSLQYLPERHERYKKADEFASVMNQLFTSWSTASYVPDKNNNKIIESKDIKPFYHEGDYFQVRGPHTTPQSPQGKPVSMQAGASKEGIALAAKYADAVYSVSWDIKQARSYKKKLSDAISKTQHPDRKIKIFPGLVTYVGETHEKALSKKAELDQKLPIEDALKQLSFFVQQDCSDWELDEPVPPLPPVKNFKGPIGRYETVLAIIKDKQPTVRELLGYLSAGGGHLTLIGTPEEIVDEMEQWFNEGVADGFNLMPPSLPHSLEDFVKYIIPELQRRALFKNSYNQSTLRTLLNLDS